MAETKPISAEDNKKKAIDATTSGIEDEVAVFLKQKYNLLRTAFPDKNLPEATSLTDADFRRMAKEAIDKRSITVGGKTITLDEVNQKLDTIPSGKDAIKTMGAETVHQLIPTREQVNKIANAVGAAVEENSSATVNGAKNWVSSWFKTGNAAIADRVKKSTTDKLSGLRKQDPSLSRFLTDGPNGTIEQIGKAVHDEITNPDAPKTDRVKFAKTEEIGQAEHNNISNAIYLNTFEATQKGILDAREKAYQDAGFMGSIAKMLGPDMANMLIGFLNFFIEMFGGKGYDKIPSDAEVHFASNVVGRAVRDVFTGDNIPQDAQDAAKAVKKAVREALDKHKEHYPSFTPKQLDQMAEEAGAGVQKNFYAIPKLPTSPTAMIDAQTKALNPNHNPATPEGYQSPATTGLVKIDQQQGLSPV